MAIPCIFASLQSSRQTPARFSESAGLIFHPMKPIYTVLSNFSPSKFSFFANAIDDHRPPYLTSATPLFQGNITTFARSADGFALYLHQNNA